MNRYAGPKRTPDVPKVERIELDHKNVRKKVIIVIILAVIALVSFGFGISGLLKGRGYDEIKADSSAGVNASDEFRFIYYQDSTATRKAVSSLYSSLSHELYQLFDSDQSYEGVYNIHYLNHHPNEEIKVDDVLYRAFSLINKYEDKHIFYGPVYEYYDNIFYCSDESQTIDYDPVLNEEVSEYFKEILSYLGDISLELKGDNTVILHVSDDYLSFQKEYGFEDFINFYYLKNAFIIDEIADRFISEGYVLGTIDSYDGYTRTLDKNTEYGYSLISKHPDTVESEGTLVYKSAMSFTAYRSYPATEIKYRYVSVNGEYRHRYLNEEGKPQTSLDDLLVMSDKMGCAELTLKSINDWISEEFNPDGSYVYLCFKDGKEVTNGQLNIKK